MPPRPPRPHTTPREAGVGGFHGFKGRLRLTRRDLGRIGSALAFGFGALWATPPSGAQEGPASPAADVITPASDLDLMERARRELARRLRERAEETQASLERARRELAEQMSEGFAQVAPESQNGPESTGSLVISPDRSRAAAVRPLSPRSNRARLLNPAPFGEPTPPLPPDPDFDPQLFEQWARIEPPPSLDQRPAETRIAPPSTITVPLPPQVPPAEDHVAALPPLQPPVLAFPALPAPEEAPVAVIPAPDPGRVAPSLPSDAMQASGANVPSSAASSASTSGTQKAPVAPPIEPPAPAPAPAPAIEQAPVAALPTPPPVESATPPAIMTPAGPAPRSGPVRDRSPATPRRARGKVEPSAPAPTRPSRILQAHRGKDPEFTLRARNRKDIERPSRAPARTAQSQPPQRPARRIQKARSIRASGPGPSGIPHITLPDSLLPTLPPLGSPL